MKRWGLINVYVYEFQITQLKIASNPFAKGFRDCDPEDWWAFALKQCGVIGMFPQGVEMSGSILQNSSAVCFISHRYQMGEARHIKEHYERHDA